MSWQVAPGTKLVYGVIPDGYLVVIPETKAEELARVRAAVDAAISWDDLRDRLPADIWSEIEQGLGEGHESKEPYDPDDVPGYADGDWPDWPAQRMLDWIPREIQDRFGTVEDSMLSGPYLELDAKRAAEIVSAFAKAGYTCQADLDLVHRASGYELS